MLGRAVVMTDKSTTAMAWAARMMASTTVDDREDPAARSGVPDVKEEGIGVNLSESLRRQPAPTTVKWRPTSVTVPEGCLRLQTEDRKVAGTQMQRRSEEPRPTGG